MSLEPLDYRSPSTKGRTWLDRVWDRPDRVAASVIVGANVVLWLSGLRRGNHVFGAEMLIWTITLDAILLTVGLFGTAVLRQELGAVFDRYMKWVMFGPLVATGMYGGVLLVGF